MKRILLCMNHLGGRELDYVHQAFEGNWVVPLGPNVDAFEQKLQTWLGAPGKEVVALSTGTAAVHLALKALGVGPGDEVICQDFTFCASCNPILYLGAQAVFVDSEPDTWNMDPMLLDEAIRARMEATGTKPKAIVMVHLYGMPSRIHDILEVASRYGIPVLEDAAEAMGSTYDGQECGTFGYYGVLSFNGNKMITTSGGGALICPDAQAKRRIMFYATQAREGYPYYQHEDIGYNYRMSNICAAIGEGQMEVLDDHLRHHRHVAEWYEQAFKSLPGFTYHAQPKLDVPASPNYWLSTITIDPNVHIVGQEEAYAHTIDGAVGGAAGVTRKAQSAHTDCEPNANVEALRLALQKAGIESRPLWKPMHLQPVYANAPAFVNGVSESLFRIGLCLPSGPYVTDEDLEYIMQTIKKSIVP